MAPVLEMLTLRVLPVVVLSQLEISKQNNFARTRILVLIGPVQLIYPSVGSVFDSELLLFYEWSSDLVTLQTN